MAKYKLKNRVLQGHLDVISGGEFSETLKSGNVEFDKDDMALVTLGSSMHGTKIITGKFSVILHKDEVYELAEYTPNDWNNFPDTTPPENIPMRVEFIWNDGALGKCCGVYRNGVWSNSEDRDCEIENVKRFRPWE